MAWEARSGLKPSSSRTCCCCRTWLNGLGSPFGFETPQFGTTAPRFLRLNGLGSPFGFETFSNRILISPEAGGLNGLGSPFGFETHGRGRVVKEQLLAKWPGKPVRV